MSEDFRIPVAEDIMSDNVVTMTPEMNILAAAELLLEQEVSNAPVVETGAGKKKLLGFVSERDLMQSYANGRFYADPKMSVSRIMRIHPIGVRPETDAFTLAMVFMHHGFRHVPVLRDDELLGMVSRRDCLWALIRHYRAWREADPANRQMPDLERLFPQHYILG